MRKQWGNRKQQQYEDRHFGEGEKEYWKLSELRRVTESWWWVCQSFPRVLIATDGGGEAVQPPAVISRDICTHKWSTHGRKIQLRNYLLYITKLLLGLPEKSRRKNVQIYHWIYGQRLIPSRFSLLYVESQYAFKFLPTQQPGQTGCFVWMPSEA